MKSKVRPVQLFSAEYLERCRALSPADIVRFLDEFRRLYGAECPPLDPGASTEHVTVEGGRRGVHPHLHTGGG